MPAKPAKKATAKVKDPVKQAESDTASSEAAAAEELEQGFRGTVPDPTPNANYTVAGVLAGKPTPETDPKLAAEANATARENDRIRSKRGS